MVRGEIDLNDAVVSPFIVLASGVQAGLSDLTLFGIDFVKPLFTLGSGADALLLTVANLFAITALAVAFAINRSSLRAFTEVEGFVAVATIALVLAPPFSLVIENLIQSSAIAGFATRVIQAAGFYSLWYFR